MQLYLLEHSEEYPDNGCRDLPYAVMRDAVALRDIEGMARGLRSMTTRRLLCGAGTTQARLSVATARIPGMLREEMTWAPGT